MKKLTKSEIARLKKKESEHTEQMPLSVAEKYIVLRKEKLTEQIEYLQNEFHRSEISVRDFQKSVKYLQNELRELIEYCNDNGLQELIKGD